MDDKKAECNEVLYRSSSRDPGRCDPQLGALIARSLLQPEVPPLCHSAVGDTAALQTAMKVFIFSILIAYGV